MSTDEPQEWIDLDHEDWEELGDCPVCGGIGEVIEEGDEDSHPCDACDGTGVEKTLPPGPEGDE
jgi:hypothetical protein